MGILRITVRVILLVGITALLNTSCKQKEKISATDIKKPPPPLKVNGYIIHPTPVADNIEVPGSVIANEATEMHPEISGRLTYLNTTEGRNVSKGALIAKIYDGDLKAQQNKLAVQLDVQQQTAKRYEELLKINGVSQQEYDLVVLQSNNIRADIAVVRSNINRTEIRAPFSGTLGLKMVSPGAYVTPQTVLTTIRQDTDLKLDFTLPEKYTSMLRPSQIVHFTTEGSLKQYEAKVVATEAGITKEDRSLKVRCLVFKSGKGILPGTFAKVTIQFEPDPNAIMIPSQAIIPQARGKQVAVFHNGITSFADVTTGIRDSANVQILTGLKAGDTIIITGLMSLKPKAKVILSKVS